MRRRRSAGPWLVAAALVAAIAAVAAIALASPSEPRRPAAAATTSVPAATATATTPAPPPQQQRPATSAVPPTVIDHGPRDRREVALTFDADMTPGMLLRLQKHAVRSWYNAAITGYLEATRTPATVFLTGLWARTYPGVVRSLAANPLFELENHSYDHYAFSEPCYGLPPVTPPSRKLADVTLARAAIVAAGAPTPHYFRFPGTCHTPAEVRMVASLGERPVDGDVKSNDPFEPSPQVVIRSVLTSVRPGSIVIMHFIGPPNAPATAFALRTIVPTLRAEGYRFVTLRELLR